MARPIWSGTVSFGLVSVPVKLYSATSPKEVRFHLLHDKDGARVQQKRVCSKDGEEVSWEHVVKGFEVSKNRYVTLSKDELEAAHPQMTRAIEIEDFVELSEIDPIYYETTYYLVPDKGSARPYALLAAAMEKSGKVGIARFVLRTRRYLCAVRPLGKALALSTMLYADEVVAQQDLDGLPGAKEKPQERELKMAEQLIGSLAAKFDPRKYRDDTRAAVLSLIEKKEAGEELIGDEPAPAQGKVVDLMEALQRSLDAAKKPAAKSAARRAHRHTRAPAATRRRRKS